MFCCDVSLSERILPETFNVEKYTNKKKDKPRNKQKEKGKIKMSMEIKKTSSYLDELVNYNAIRKVRNNS